MILNLTLKQKIILGIVIGIIVIGIVVIAFFLFKEEGTVINLNQMMEFDANTEELNSVEGKNEQLSENTAEEIREGKIVVHIIGEVNKTGILILEEGARIADAIEAAGGATKEADLNEVNLAYLLKDGQKVYIPNKSEKEQNEENMYIISESGNNVIVKSNAQSKGENSKVNINEATQNELETLPGIGPSIASRIVEYREQNGKFQKIEELQNVKGIGDSKFANIKDYVTVK